MAGSAVAGAGGTRLQDAYGEREFSGCAGFESSSPVEGVAVTSDRSDCSSVDGHDGIIVICGVVKRVGHVRAELRRVFVGEVEVAPVLNRRNEVEDFTGSVSVEFNGGGADTQNRLRPERKNAAARVEARAVDGSEVARAVLERLRRIAGLYELARRQIDGKGAALVGGTRQRNAVGAWRCSNR